MTPQMQPSVNLYWRLAQEAVEYVKGKVNAGSANRTEDYQSRDKKKFQKLNEQYLNIQRQTQQFAIKDAKEPVKTPNGLQPPEIIDMHDEVCMEAFFAEFSGFGNCGEQAAVAYKYLSRLPIAGLVLHQPDGWRPRVRRAGSRPRRDRGSNLPNGQGQGSVRSSCGDLRSVGRGRRLLPRCQRMGHGNRSNAQGSSANRGPGRPRFGSSASHDSPTSTVRPRLPHGRLRSNCLLVFDKLG